jgi:hypothetical protein
LAHSPIRIPAGSKNLLQLVNDWLDAGDRLGQLGQEQQQLKAATPPPSPGTIHEARLAWMRALNALRNLAPLAQLTRHLARGQEFLDAVHDCSNCQNVVPVVCSRFGHVKTPAGLEISSVPHSVFGGRK